LPDLLHPDLMIYKNTQKLIFYTAIFD